MPSVVITGVTNPLLPGIETPMQLLAHHARVSNTANQFNHDTGPKLLRSLIKRKEWSPFEMVHVVVELRTTRDIGRQILRHGKAFGFQEFSQRYAIVPENAIWREARIQHPTDRQMSLELPDHDLRKREWVDYQRRVFDTCAGAYNWALRNELAKECARVVLPEGLTPTLMYMAGSLRGWIHYAQLRCDQKTQKEHRLLAYECYEGIINLFPELVGILDEVGQ